MNKIIPISIVGVFVLSGFGIIAGVITTNPLLDGPYGPTEGYVGVEYTFYFVLPTNPNGDEYYTKWNWDDGNITDWLGPYASSQITTASHTWMHVGVYEIRVKLKDTNGTESDWSEPHMITIIEGGPPNKPILNGPPVGKVGVAYNFTVVTTDPEGDEFCYLLDWGDGNSSGWLGPYASGETFTISHAWNEPGNYTIQVKAKNPYGEESNSDPFVIQIVELKTSFIIGSSNNRRETEDLIIIHTNILIIFPSDSILHLKATVVIAQNHPLGFLISFIFGGIFKAAIL
jgi:hypothetical protein